MDWKYFVKLFVFTVIGLLIAKAICGPYCAWAATTEENNHEYLAEYSAICDSMGGEPELNRVTPEEYVMCAHAWRGHRIVAAEREVTVTSSHPKAGEVMINGDVVKEGYEWLYTVYRYHQVIRCIDTNLNEFTYVIDTW